MEVICLFVGSFFLGGGVKHTRNQSNPLQLAHDSRLMPPSPLPPPKTHIRSFFKTHFLCASIRFFCLAFDTRQGRWQSTNRALSCLSPPKKGLFSNKKPTKKGLLIQKNDKKGLLFSPSAGARRHTSAAPPPPRRACARGGSGRGRCQRRRWRRPARPGVFLVVLGGGVSVFC